MNLNLLSGTKIANIGNILSEEDADTLHKYAVEVKLSGLSQENLAASDPQEFQPDPYDDNFDPEVVRDFWNDINVYIPLAPQNIQDIVKKLQMSVAAAFDLYLDQVEESKYSYNLEDLGLYAIHVYRDGQRLDLHQDCHDYAFVVYLTDPKDYSGGELVYSELDISHVPTKCSLLIAPSELTHEVLPVTSGVRCSLTAFIPVTPRD